MPTCKKMKPLLSLYANAELHARQNARVAAHVAQCARCRAEVETYRNLALRLHKLPAPNLPEHALHGFAEAILEQIAPQPLRTLGSWRAGIAALFRPQWHYAWAAAAMIAIVLGLGLWYAPLEREHQTMQQLPQLLQARAWDKIYYGLLEKDSRTALLHEPVPAHLLKTAVAELLKKGERDLRVRVGTQRLVRALTGRKVERREDFPSVKIMGVVTTSGYVSQAENREREETASAFLRDLQNLPDHSQVTLAELVNEKPNE